MAVRPETGSGRFLLLKRPNFSSGGRIAAVVDERGVFQVSETHLNQFKNKSLRLSTRRL